MTELTGEEEALAERYGAMLSGGRVTTLVRAVRGELVRMLVVAGGPNGVPIS